MAIILQNNQREFFVNVAFALVCLALFLIFPTANVFQQVVSMLAFLCVIPFLYIKFVLKKKIASFGLSSGDANTGLVWSGISLLLLGVIFYIIVQYTGYFKNYILPQSVSQQFVYFLGYELILVASFLFLYDFFFRGFLMNILEKQMGAKAVAFQYVFFVAMFILAGSFSQDNARYMLLGLFSGIVVHKSGSIWYFFGTSVLFMVVTDAIFVNMSH